MKLEVIEEIALAHPFNKGFDKVYYCKDEDEAFKIAHCEKDPSEVTEEPVNLLTGETAGEVKEEKKSENRVWTTTYYIGLDLLPGKSTLIL